MTGGAQNDRLRSAMADAEVDETELANHLEVSVRSVARWVREGRTPYPKHRRRLAAYLDVEERWLFPTAEPSDPGLTALTSAELVQTWPRRALVPLSVWQQLIANATWQIDILAMAGLFLPEQQPQLADQLRAKIDTGATVRILLGDPDSTAVTLRGVEENIGAALAAKIHNVLSFYQGSGLDIRLHDTTLYNSLYRFDHDLLVNAHVLGSPAAHNPVFHLRQIDGGILFNHHMTAFDRAWWSARNAFHDPETES
jgi:transcriptional regulator with XRE-family HTH domain